MNNVCLGKEMILIAFLIGFFMEKNEVNVKFVYLTTVYSGNKQL